MPTDMICYNAAINTPRHDFAPPHNLLFPNREHAYTHVIPPAPASTRAGRKRSHGDVFSISEGTTDESTSWSKRPRLSRSEGSPSITTKPVILALHLDEGQTHVSKQSIPLSKIAFSATSIVSAEEQLASRQLRDGQEPKLEAKQDALGANENLRQPQLQDITSNLLGSEQAVAKSQNISFWKTRDKDETSKKYSTAGSTAVLGIPEDGSQVMAFLPTHRLMQLSMKCALLQREYNELNRNTNTNLENLEKKIFGHQILIHSCKAKMDELERLLVIPGQVHNEALHLKVLEILQEQDESELKLLELEERKAAMMAEVEKLRNEWHVQLEALSASYNDLFTKAGILPSDNGEDNEADSTPENRMGIAIPNEEEKTFGSRSYDARPNMRVDSMAVDKSNGDHRVANTSPAAKVDVPSTTDDINNASKSLNEAELQYRIYLARLALQEAQQAHDLHRTRYSQLFAQYRAKHPEQPVEKLATSFSPIFLRRGQQLTEPLRVAEDALAKLEKCAIESGFYTLPADQVDPAVNPYFDDEELAAICCRRNYDHIWRWMDVEGEMDPPDSYSSNLWSDDGISSDKEFRDADIVTCVQDGTSIHEEPGHVVPSKSKHVDMRSIIFGLGKPFAFCYDSENPKEASMGDSTQFILAEKTQLRSSETPQPQSTYSCVGQDDAVPQQSGSGTYPGSSSEDTDSDLTSVCSGISAAPRVAKRKFEKDIEVCDSFSVVAESSKRQKIDAWRMESYHRRPKIHT